MRAIYRRDGWILGKCKTCGRFNYVEPHGMTAKCRCSTEWTEHGAIPYGQRVDTIRGPVLRSPRRGRP